MRQNINWKVIRCQSPGWKRSSCLNSCYKAKTRANGKSYSLTNFHGWIPPRSGFLPAFENFRNGWCSGRDNIMLVVCGSATSWILSNLSRSKGGLYGRLTAEIKLSPFTATFPLPLEAILILIFLNPLPKSTP